MLNQQTLEKVHSLPLNGMAEAYCRQMEDTSAASLSFEERFGLLVDHHWIWREVQAMARRLKKSKLDAEPCAEDIEYSHPRGLDRQLMRSHRRWRRRHAAMRTPWVHRPAPKLFRDRDLLEICDDRYGRRSTILTSQLPVTSWHARIGDPTLADSILDRLVHNAYRLDPTGESIRKKKGRGPSEQRAGGGA
jgi:hypothetical protein